MFNGEVEKGEEVEACLSCMKMHFKIYNYSYRLKSQMAIYNLTSNTNIWWEDIKELKILKKNL